MWMFAAVDFRGSLAQNSFMSAEARQINYAAGPISDLQAVIDSMTSLEPLDGEVERRVRERAEQVHAELIRRPATNIAVELLRESRDEE